MQIQISWLILQKPTDLALHCLLRQGSSCSAREGLRKWMVCFSLVCGLCIVCLGLLFLLVSLVGYLLWLTAIILYLCFYYYLIFVFLPLTLVLLNKLRCHAYFQPIKLFDLACCYKFTYLMANSADPDQLASSEANWSGSTLFAKAGHIQIQQD